MVRCGNSIRRRNKVKVTRNQKPRRKYKTKFVGDVRIQNQWDHNKTIRQNYEAIGLQADPNSHQALKESIQGADKALDEPEFFHVPDSDFLNERNHRRPEHHMSEDEISYLRKLIAKHGEDYKAMERDIKVNNMQWTENKLKRRCARLALLDAKVIQQQTAADDEDEDEESK
ncbi:TPA: hypothetical protein N0F65_002446 [Lagenidium giganteum]|uniref:Nucleolar protein 16 n=1 Tax=Lagenidium giganteum TaxID=4803 RepID=A0AAV2YHQ2_9STRA|nr:TPA: hypothetical protein N0F65_002446 [Lagenidium giganteum]